MKKLLLAAGAAMLTVPSAQAATLIDLDARTNAGTSVGVANAVTVSLAAGSYSLKFIEGAYSAFNRWGATSSGCAAGGVNCWLGYENSAKYVINGVVYGFGAKDGNGGTGGGAYYADTATSLAAASQYEGRLILTSDQDVQFYIYDTNLSDNVGGVSLAISAVPEPATWAMMIAGFGFVGAAMRRRKTAVSAVRFA